MPITCERCCHFIELRQKCNGTEITTIIGSLFITFFSIFCICRGGGGEEISEIIVEGFEF